MYFGSPSGPTAMSGYGEPLAMKAVRDASLVGDMQAMSGALGAEVNVPNALRLLADGWQFFDTGNTSYGAGSVRPQTWNEWLDANGTTMLIGAGALLLFWKAPDWIAALRRY